MQHYDFKHFTTRMTYVHTFKTLHLKIPFDVTYLTANSALF